MLLKIAIVVGIALAAWIGGATFAQIFSLGFFGIFLALFIVSLVLMRLFVWANRGMVAWFLYCVMLFFAYNYGTVVKYNLSDMDTYTLGAAAPVRIEMLERAGTKTGVVRLTNVGSDMLVNAKVMCAIYFDNGDRVERDFYNGIGGPAQYAPGAHKDTMVIASNVFEKYRANPNDMTCSIHSAEFVKRPAYMNDLKLDFGRAADGRTDFFVTNNSTVAVKNIQFNCVTNKDESMRVQAYPAYLTDLRKDTIVGATETVKFTSDATFIHYKSCVVTNAVAL